jgi:coproporphyrinogen III oxidase-like Fe-S oxidoreductase
VRRTHTGWGRVTGPTLKCASFCRYVFQEDLARAYFERLHREMEIAARLGYRFHSLYIGGGEVFTWEVVGRWWLESLFTTFRETPT